MMGRAEAKKCRGVAAKPNFSAQDRTDLQFSAKEACRSMGTPEKLDWTKLKRISRYLLAHQRLALVFSGHVVRKNVVVVYADSDWAGCLRTRTWT